MYLFKLGIFCVCVFKVNLYLFIYLISAHFHLKVDRIIPTDLILGLSEAPQSQGINSRRMGILHPPVCVHIVTYRKKLPEA